MNPYWFGSIVAAMLGITAFLSGFFETWIVRRCTKCGGPGPLSALCHLYAGLLPGGRPRHLFAMQRLGVMHEHILCEKCLNDALDLVFPLPRLP